MKRQLWIAAFAAVGITRAQTQIDLGRQTKNVDFSNATYTRPLQTGTSLPASCSNGSLFFKLDAPAGQNIYACTAPATWTLESGNTTATLLANDGQSFTAATTVTIVHNANTLNPIVECFDNATPPAQIEYNSLTIVDSNTVSITFSQAQSGKCVVNTSGGPGAATVTSAGTLTAGLPVLGNGGSQIHTGQIGIAGLAAAALTGTGALLATSTGTLTAGDCAAIDLAGNLVDAGAPCGTGMGGINASTGLTGDGSLANPLQINAASVVQKLTGSISWQPGGSYLAAGTCTTTTIALPGTALGDAVAPGWPIGVFQTAANSLVWGEMFVSAPDTVTIKICNAGALAISFADESYKAMVVR